MNRDKLTEMLRDYRSYKFAIMNWATHDGPDWGNKRIATPNGDLIIGLNQWDYRRYTRIVGSIDGAVNEVLDDNQRMVIKRKYLDQNRVSLFEIAKQLDRDESTIRRWHREALKQLSKALVFLNHEIEIENLDFHLDRIS